jgi:hypothetical protein
LHAHVRSINTAWDLFCVTFNINGTHNQVQVFCLQKSRYLPASNSSLRTVFILIALAISVCLLVLPAGATPPSDVTVKVDKTTDQISVTITHPVADPTTHYIRNVKVNINGRVVIDRDYTSQPTKDVFTYTYPVPVNAGDTLRVTATCVLGGDREAVLEIPTPSGTVAATPQPAAVPQPTAKSASGILPLAGLAAVGILVMGKKN